MQDFESYIFREKRPQKSSEKYSTIFYYKNGIQLARRQYGELFIGNEVFYKYTIADMITERIFDDKVYQDDLINYNKRKIALEDKFRTDLFEELGISNHPKRNKLYEIAASIHSDTYHGLYDIADQLVELIKD